MESAGYDIYLDQQICAITTRVKVRDINGERKLVRCGWYIQLGSIE
jgi:hypothetical protein